MTACVGRVMPVHVFRAAAPNVYSLMTPKVRPQSQAGRKPTMRKSKSVFHATAHWNVRNLQAGNIIDRHDGPKATVSYEKFCRSADEQLRGLLLELGIPARLARGDAEWHSVSGNPMRFGGDRLRIRTDEVWKSGLSALDRRIVALASGWQEKRLEKRALR
jgi:hypothetical protein